MATNDVLRLQGDYLIRTRVNSAGASTGGTITFDLGGDNTASYSTGTVVIKGDLRVDGNVLFGSVTNTDVENTRITDNEITLNAGEPTAATYGKVTKGTAGIKISRGRLGQDQDQFAAFLTWNDNATWHGTGAISNINGIWEFKVGKTGRPQYGAIKVNAIRIDENSASTAGSGAGQGARLNIFGSDNPTSVLSVSGTNNYESRVTDPDDIPNKAYVDNKLVGYQPDARMIRIGKSFVTLTDTFEDGVTSQIIGVLNGDPSDPNQRFNPTVGTVVMKISPTVAQFAQLQFVATKIQPTTSGADLFLATAGAGQIKLQGPLLLVDSVVPSPSTGQTGLYVGDAQGGGTGVFFKRKDTQGVEREDEFVSRKKALIFSIIFG